MIMMTNCMMKMEPVAMGGRTTRFVPMHIWRDFPLRSQNGGGGGSSVNINLVPTSSQKPAKPLKKKNVSLFTFNRLKKKVQKQELEISLFKKRLEGLDFQNRQKQDVQVVLIDPTGRCSKLHLEAQKVPDNFYDFLNRLGIDKEKIQKTKSASAETLVKDEKPAKAVQRNYVFKEKCFNGLSLDLDKLHNWVEKFFLPNVCAKYDWFALWRILQEKDFLRDHKTSTFVRQLTFWFGEEQMKGVAAAINLYRSGYLGNYPHHKWDGGEFLRLMKGKQSEEGFNRLQALCIELHDELDIADFHVKKP